jgi:hypothetical protein
MYERLLDEATRVSWTSSQEEAEGVSALRKQLFHQFAQSPAETLPILLKALQQPDIFRQSTAVEIIDVMGYPANETAIPALISQVEAHDPNSPVWVAAVNALSHLGPDIVIPFLIRTLLEIGEPFHQPSRIEASMTLNENIEGLSMMLSRTMLESEWAIRCCPAINYLLAHIGQDGAINSDIVDSLLYVVEKAGDNVKYMLPTLLALVRKYEGSDIGRRARELVFSSTPEVLENYKFLLP